VESFSTSSLSDTSCLFIVLLPVSTVHNSSGLSSCLHITLVVPPPVSI
jgi:hypothetical protein